MSINRIFQCVADKNELENFDVSDSCCYVGNEELHVLVLCFTRFMLGLGFKGN
jgi:hypothetical protein